ncbi:MAG: hypothetical protein WC192_00270 [Candidatus Babeliales bacterium]
MPVKLCGAKCRTKGGAPCGGWAMKNGRCRMHGGAYKLEKHGMYTLRAKAQRKQINAFLREVDEMNNQIDRLAKPTGLELK